MTKINQQKQELAKTILIAIIKASCKSVIIEKEYVFDRLSGRKYRSDLYITDLGIAIEIDGGIYTRSCSHSSISGILRDIEKNNCYVMNKIPCIRLTYKMIYNGEAQKIIESVIKIYKK